jgi:hypothetical protein
MNNPHMRVTELLVPDIGTPAPEVRVHWMLYVVVGVLTSAVLLYGVVEQLFDTNFYVLWEATALLAGDRPYRDFYLMGWPLLTLISTAMQWVVGYRLIGEFLIQWTFIVAGILIGFRLATRLSHSIWASLTTTLVAIAIVAATPTFQFPKLFFYPIAVWVAWWYMEAPSIRRAAAVGLVTAAAFLYRHDHGIYIALAALLAFVLARAINPATKGWRSSALEAIAFAVTAAVTVMPWAMLVQRREGLIDYVQTRAAWGRTWSPDRFPYYALRDLNPASVVPGGTFPPRAAAEHWLLQLTLLMPVFVVVRAAIEAITRRRNGHPISLEIAQAVVAAVMVMIVGIRLFREDGYFTVVLPLSAALGAQLLVGPQRNAVKAWRVAQRILCAGMLVVTVVAVVGYVNAWDLLNWSEIDELAPTYRQLLTTPPIDALESDDRARHVQPADWLTSDADERQKIALRYMHECTRDGDRIFVTGSTPYQVGYYTERPIAGGQLQWHHGWRSDPVHARQSLILLQNQSVPFAFSTHDPVLVDLEKYPDIQRYFEQNYIEVEGSQGLLLVDRRRQPTARFGVLGLPCFR